MFYLFLTTHDPTGALWLNKILNDAKFLEYELRYRLGVAKRTAPPPGQPPLLIVEPTVPKPTVLPRPSTEQIASAILKHFSGRTTNKRQVYREFVDELFFPNEIDKALKLLKKTGKADFADILRHRTEIKFSNLESTSL